MASTVFDVVREALEAEKASVEQRIDVLGSFQGNISRQFRIIKGFVNSLVGSVKNLLGQFSNLTGYLDSEIEAVATSIVEASLSNSSGAEGLAASGDIRSTDEFNAQAQETINRFQSSLLVDPLNVFVLPRVIYDNMSEQNVQRATSLNEALETVGLAKLMHDAIPPAYYTSLSKDVLLSAQPQLLEVLRSLQLACGAIAGGSDPAQLVASIENDFEAVIRLIGRESVYDASQFSPTEFLTIINRMKDAAADIEATTESLTAAKTNISSFQTELLSSFDSSFSECGTLASAGQVIQAVSARIDELVNPSLANSEVLSLTATREIILELVSALAMVRDYVSKKQTLEDALLTEVSSERTLFEDSQAALAVVPALSTSLPETLRKFARVMEARLTSPAVSPLAVSLFSTLTTVIPQEFTKSENLQVAMNSYSIDVTEENKSLVVSSIQDIEELGLDRLFEAIISGSLTVAFDTRTAYASKVGYAIQEVALALEGALSGVSLALGACKISNRYSARRLSEMLAELQESLQVQVFSQVSFRDALKKRLVTLTDKKLKRVSRFIEELGGISLAERCE